MPYSNINTWIFDLDNTLYPSSSGLLEQAIDRMIKFISANKNISYDDALALNKHYVDNYGTTLGGVIAEEKVCHKEYFDYIFSELDFSVISPCTQTKKLISGLSGRKIIFTSTQVNYAKEVLGHLGMKDTFEAIYDLPWTDFKDKQQIQTYKKLLEELQVPANKCVMIEDSVNNLRPAKELGMRTVLIGENKINNDFVDEQAKDVLSWLVNINMNNKNS